MSKVEINKKDLLIGIVGVFLFFFIANVKLMPHSNKTSGTVNYAPEGFRKTIETSINGKVVSTKQDGLFWVKVNDETRKYPFSYCVENLPADWKVNYPKDFIIKDDSISKEANTDSFYVFRQNRKWFYVLPN